MTLTNHGNEIPGPLVVRSEVFAELDKQYRNQIVQMKDGNYHKIKWVISYNIDKAMLLVSYTEGDTGWVVIRRGRLYEA